MDDRIEHINERVVAEILWSQWPYKIRPTTLMGKNPYHNWTDHDDDRISLNKIL